MKDAPKKRPRKGQPTAQLIKDLPVVTKPERCRDGKCSQTIRTAVYRYDTAEPKQFEQQCIVMALPKTPAPRMDFRRQDA